MTVWLRAVHFKSGKLSFMECAKVPIADAPNWTKPTFEFNLKIVADATAYPQLIKDSLEFVLDCRSARSE
jgi:hypothetical protein